MFEIFCDLLTIASLIGISYLVFYRWIPDLVLNYQLNKAIEAKEIESRWLAKHQMERKQIMPGSGEPI